VVQGVAELTDEQDPVVGVDRDNADRPIPEVDHAVDPRLAIGPDHLVVQDFDPRILVGRAPG
jgi:hypothetical protein